MMDRKFLVTGLIGLLAIIATWGAPIHAKDGAEVISHVFASRVIQDRDGTIYPQDQLMGFKQGTASFHTVTHVMLDKGTYNVTVQIWSPEGKQISDKKVPTITAQHADWIEALWIEWRNIPFNIAGRHELRIVIGTTVIAVFPLLIS